MATCWNCRAGVPDMAERCAACGATLAGATSPSARNVEDPGAGTSSEPRVWWALLLVTAAAGFALSPAWFFGIGLVWTLAAAVFGVVRRRLRAQDPPRAERVDRFVARWALQGLTVAWMSALLIAAGVHGSQREPVVASVPSTPAVAPPVTEFTPTVEAPPQASDFSSIGECYVDSRTSSTQCDSWFPDEAADSDASSDLGSSYDATDELETPESDGPIVATYVDWVPEDDAHGVAFVSITNNTDDVVKVNCTVTVFTDYGDFGVDSFDNEPIPAHTKKDFRLGLIVQNRAAYLVTRGEIRDC